MTKVITYGTYDLLHYGHIRLLERAKSLGDYLIVGVTADDFDAARGKINVQQSLLERVEAVRATGLADKIIVEEYEGQKIDDILRYDVDIFTVGSDWEGVFDYLNEFCKVVYLDRTEGVSSTQIRGAKNEIRIGLIGDTQVMTKFAKETQYVNGVKLSGFYTINPNLDDSRIADVRRYATLDELVADSDALYVSSRPALHYEQIKVALQSGRHVLYECPLTFDVNQAKELNAIAEQNNCILCPGIKTAYSLPYTRMILLAKSGKIGDVVSIDVTCTSLKEIDFNNPVELSYTWASMADWGPTALLPIFQVLGLDYKSKDVFCRCANINDRKFDTFSKISFEYDDAVASIKVGKGIKSEGDLVISGTKGYIYVPSPWWKQDYFEMRFEDPNEKKRYFYQLEGEGIRYEIIAFLKAINHKRNPYYLNNETSMAIVKVMEEFYN